MLPWMSVRMQECVLDQELAIGQYGIKKLGSASNGNDRNKRHGYPGGWMADWISEEWYRYTYTDAIFTDPS
jgi:hypothetical protein